MHHFLDLILHPERLQVEPHLPGLEFRRVQDVVDHERQALPLMHDRERVGRIGPRALGRDDDALPEVAGWS